MAVSAARSEKTARMVSLAKSGPVSPELRAENVIAPGLPSAADISPLDLPKLSFDYRTVVRISTIFREGPSSVNAASTAIVDGR